MSTPKEVPFISGPRTSGFESVGPDIPVKAAPTSATTLEQKARAADLFLRGGLSADQLAKAQATQGGFEVLVGRSNFLPASFLEVGVANARATCQVRTSGVDFRGRSGSWTGTAFLLSSNVLVTNHHVLNSRAVAAAGTAVFDYQLGTDGQPRPPRSFRLRPDRLFLTSPAVGGLDYTFCWVDGEPGREFGTVRVDRRTFAIAEREFANVVSHPDGRMKEVSLQENEVRWQDEAVIHYTSDTEPGSSGAAVCNNSWQLVALHHASRSSNVPEFPVLNEGIKLSAIAADLERLAVGTGPDARDAAALLAMFGGSDERLGFFGTLGRAQPEAGNNGLETVVNTYKGTEQDLDVGFWNVEWLTKHYEEKKAAVAKVMHELNLDVWSLEESSEKGAEAVAAELMATYGHEFGVLAAEPGVEGGKQSCTILWNKSTASVTKEDWGDPIETWLKARSTDFDELGLGEFEAVHGKIFDRYPALFKVTSKANGAGGQPVSFFLVPLHLKAMSEGSMRRRMASRILAEAVKRKAEDGAGEDFILGGDANAPLHTDDFDNLTDAGLVAASAADAANGAISYLKGPKSLIDHVFLSPNLAATAGEDDFLIVAAEKTFPGYIQNVSDHRPVLVRLSLGGAGEESVRPAKGKKANGAMDELRKRLADTSFVPESVVDETGDGFERAKKKKAKKKPKPSGGGGSPALSGRTGYDPSFLGGGLMVPLPGLPSGPESTPVPVDKSAQGIDRFVLPYTHFSVVMNGDRRMPFYAAVNIDGTQLRRIPRGGDSWFLDPRIPAEAQAGNPVYANNDLDRGHMVRRLDPVWGTPEVAARADADTFCFTNACPQHKNLNQKEWLELEDYVLNSAGTHDLKVCVMTGPVLRPGDRPYRGVKLPDEFWKVVAIRRADTGRLSVTAYVLSQSDMITGFEFVFGRFKTYQVKVSKVANLTGLDFGQLVAFDPLARGGFEATGTQAVEVTGPQSLVL